MLIHNTIPITLYDNLLKLRDTGKAFALKRDALKMMTNNKYNVDLAKVSDKKVLYVSGKEMHFDIKAPSNKSERDRSFMRLFNSPAIMASGISTIFLSSDPHELCKRIELILQQKQVGIVSDKINEQIVAIFDKLLEDKCISIKKRKILLHKCLH